MFKSVSKFNYCLSFLWTPRTCLSILSWEPYLLPQYLQGSSLAKIFCLFSRLAGKVEVSWILEHLVPLACLTWDLRLIIFKFFPCSKHKWHYFTCHQAFVFHSNMWYLILLIFLGGIGKLLSTESGRLTWTKNKNYVPKVGSWLEPKTKIITWTFLNELNFLSSFEIGW